MLQLVSFGAGRWRFTCRGYQTTEMDTGSTDNISGCEVRRISDRVRRSPEAGSGSIATSSRNRDAG